MSEFKPKKNDVLGILFAFYTVVVSFMLGISGNIIYDLFIKSLSFGFKISFVLGTLILLIGLILIVYRFYLKPLLDKSKQTSEK